jgi:hypothetical protein
VRNTRQHHHACMQPVNAHSDVGLWTKLQLSCIARVWPGLYTHTVRLSATWRLTNHNQEHSKSTHKSAKCKLQYY